MVGSELDVKFIRKALLDREVHLNSEFNGNFSTFIEKEVGVVPDPLVCEIYQLFDGFPDGVVDGGSCIRIWPSADIVANRDRNSLSSRIAFADLMMGSQDLTLDITDAHQPILYADTGEEVAGSLSEFLISLTHGRLDFQ